MLASWTWWLLGAELRDPDRGCCSHMYSSSSSCLVVACARWFLRLAVQLPALLCLEAMACALAFLTFPLRVLAAADRERKLDRLLGEMQAQMEKAVWENRQLQEKLRAALKEQAALEEILDEMDQEHEHAFARIRLLENQMKALRKENLRLRELKGKAARDTQKKAAAARGGDEEEEEEEEEEKEGFVFVPGDDSSQASAAEEEARQVRLLAATARRRSLFSVGMSAAVGGVAAWAAPGAAPLPLLAGLLAVVGMSMCSVARLFRAPGGGARTSASAASGAVALLSLNWFLLGVLTYPMLPGVARAVLPRAARIAGPALAWLAAAVPL